MTGRSKARPATISITAALAFLLTSCQQGLPQDSLDPAGPEARMIDSLFTPVFWIAAAVFVLVEGLLIVALIRFRHRPGRPVPKQTHGNKWLEIGWTVLPALILAGIAVPTVITIAALARRPTGDVLDVNVTAHQFWWEAEYPGLDVVTAGEIHIPTGRPVFVSLESVDVIHSFWVPRLAGKQDVVPGRTNTMTIEADRPGTYFAQCAEFCGLAHADMRFRVVAQTPTDFDEWIAQQKEPAGEPPEEALRIMQDKGCGGCHVIKGVDGFVGRIGPNLTHFGSRRTFAGAIMRNDPESLARWLDDPLSVKPGVDMPDTGLTRDEIDTLVEYLRGLE